MKDEIKGSSIKPEAIFKLVETGEN